MPIKVLDANVKGKGGYIEKGVNDGQTGWRSPGGGGVSTAEKAIRLRAGWSARNQRVCDRLQSGRATLRRDTGMGQRGQYSCGRQKTQMPGPGPSPLLRTAPDAGLRRLWPYPSMLRLTGVPCDPSPPLQRSLGAI